MKAHIYTKILISVYFLLLAEYLQSSSKFMVLKERVGEHARGM